MEVSEKYKTHPEDIFNMDETEFRLVEGESKKWLPGVLGNVAIYLALPTVTT
jgi:hypothetical protein